MKKSVEILLQEAISLKASDIFFFPKNDRYQIKVNVLGTNRIIKECSKEFGGQLINYLKFQSNMAVNEKRRPQLGSWIYSDEKNEVFCRLSSVGDFLGNESLVVRLIFPSTFFEENYFFEEQIYTLQKACIKNGLIVFSGPMGSGKTTTMYNLARKLANEKHVMSIEDPIEIYEPNFLQLQVNNKAQMSYSELLKVALRHHPDVFLIGEIRDNMTAKVAINAALSGHLILTTVHARNVYGVYQRLKNLGISDEELQQTMQVISYQRLIPTIDGRAKVLFDQIEGKDLDKDIIQGNIQSRMTKDWREKLEYCYLNNWINKESFETFIEG
ncbi:competence type IV pilus ATPase ComGA [Ligilactobacillus salivarius]|mgnify:FL=1|uniref:competence type IV pilus ATPase ComGA n=1 Tax=Ligilactobacillus salivarius TaxID=1624 RepID=UPI0018985B1B|nr:competence type IV pilus ATPase ComGA [Ligilactobacillus salivarius]MDE1507773.1 competence type IV pilus ATPase ComGA [Ligilactobacillus salivarius]MDE1522563.1 competence type IV pilus ATPase ComGA [Ligilactobacillus salivarius]